MDRLIHNMRNMGGGIEFREFSPGFILDTGPRLRLKKERENIRDYPFSIVCHLITECFSFCITPFVSWESNVSSV